MNCRRVVFLAGVFVLTLLATAQAEVAVSRVFSDHMVLQRSRPVPVFGTAEPGEQVTVSFGGHTVSGKANAQGNWKVFLPLMAENSQAQTLTITGKNTLSFSDVLVGDVWLCSGQSNMDMGLGGCNRPEDIASADFSGIRSFRTPLVAAAEPVKMVKGNVSWQVCTPKTAGGFSAAAFYFGRKVYRETGGKIPIGLLVASVGGTPIDLWLVQEGVIDIPKLHPLLSQPVLPGGPFHLGNGMIHPIAPYGIAGVLWYQGENAERTVQSPDSYYLKMKALIQGWQQLWGMDELPFYYVMIANWGKIPENATPELKVGGWDADTRLQQVNAMALPNAGCASALDIGDSSTGDKIWDGWHPKDKLDVGERLALWALKNRYDRRDLVASGPVLKDAIVSGNTVVCSFNYVGHGLMVGEKKWYEPTREIPGGTLQRFVIAGADGKWFNAEARIRGETVVLSSPSVAAPRKVSYACWQNPEGCNLYNREGLPAAPFHVEDVTRHYTILAKAGYGGTVLPSGSSRLLERMTALCTIQPKRGYFIEDVRVDGVSVGAVTHYTFDPLTADHQIEASFSKTAPVYTIKTAASPGGSVSPAGAQQVKQGGSQSFDLVTGCRPTLTVDGCAIGARDSFTFTNVRANHEMSVAFNPILMAGAGVGGTIEPRGEQVLDYAADETFKVTANPGYAISEVTVDGQGQGAKEAYTFAQTRSNHTITATFAARDGGVLLSQGKVATASSTANGNAAGRAVDGNANSQWVADGASVPQWLIVDLGTNRDIARCETTFEYPHVVYQYTIEHSIDQNAWNVFADRRSNTTNGDPAYTDVSAPVTARYLRLTITSTSGGGWAAVREFRVYGVEGTAK